MNFALHSPFRLSSDPVLITTSLSVSPSCGNYLICSLHCGHRRASPNPAQRFSTFLSSGSGSSFPQFLQPALTRITGFGLSAPLWERRYFRQRLHRLRTPNSDQCPAFPGGGSALPQLPQPFFFPRKSFGVVVENVVPARFAATIFATPDPTARKVL